MIKSDFAIMLISIIFGGMYVSSLAETSPLPLDMGYIFLVGSNILLSILVQQQVVILEILQENMSVCPSTPPYLLYFISEVKLNAVKNNLA